MRNSWCWLLALLLACAPAAGADFEATLQALTRDLPEEVGDLIYRIVDCNHWAGEDGYDDERAAEIDSAMKELRCDTVDREEGALRQRYKASPDVIRAFEIAKELLF